jgi:hypothetical protein
MDARVLTDRINPGSGSDQAKMVPIGILGGTFQRLA